MPVEVAEIRIVVRRPRRTVRQGDDRVEVVRGHELVDCRLNRRRRRLPEGSAIGVPAVRRVGGLEDRIVPRSLEVLMGGIEGNQVGERLRVRLA